jgi:hypothetical protein
MWTQAILLLLSLRGVVARPASEPSVTSSKLFTSPSSFTFTIEHLLIYRSFHISYRYWDTVLFWQGLHCSADPGMGWYSQGRCVQEGSEEPPESCADMMCITEMEVRYDPETEKCGCYWIPGLEPPPPITVEVRAIKPATPTFPPSALRCLTGYHLLQSHSPGASSCERMIARERCVLLKCILCLMSQVGCAIVSGLTDSDLLRMEKWRVATPCLVGSELEWDSAT